MNTMDAELSKKLSNNYIKHKNLCKKNAKLRHEKLKDDIDYKNKKNKKAKEYYLKNKLQILEKSKSARHALKEQKIN